MRLEEIVSGILEREGWPELSNRAADRGHWTKGGITLADWSAYVGHQASVADLTGVTEAQAREYYRHRYVIGPGFDAIADEALRLNVIDWAVTSWYDDPTRALQISLATRGLYHGPIDGVFGPHTKAAVQADPDQAQTRCDVARARVSFYVDLALRDPLAVTFLRLNPSAQLHNVRGWVNRALGFVA